MSFRRPSVVPLVSLGVLRKAQLSVSRLWSVYNEQLVVRPVLTRSLTSMVGLVSGDALAQFSAGGKYDSARALRTAAYAFLISGPVNYKFYKFLDQAIFPAAPTSWKAVATKVLIDQIMFSPPLLCVYLSAMKAMEGCPFEAKSTIEEKALPCITAGFGFWVPAHVVNFKVVPDAYRTLIVISLGVVWSAMLSSITAPKVLTIQTDSLPYEYCSSTVHTVNQWDTSILNTNL